MNQFNEGIDYAFKFIVDHLVGHNINGILIPAITKQKLEELYLKIPKKCDFCSHPCEDNWCPTSEE